MPWFSHNSLSLFFGQDRLCGEEQEGEDHVAKFATRTEKQVSNWLSQTQITRKNSTTALPHIRQCKDWDCGIACLQMILSWIGEPPSQSCNPPETIATPSWNSLNDCLGNIKSIWTVDLVCTLANMVDSQGSVFFATHTLDINPDWKQLDYYKESFEEDELRVSQRIRQLRLSSQTKAQLWQYSSAVDTLSWDYLTDILMEYELVALLLIDYSVFLEASDTRKDKQPYIGHYVVLSGTNKSIVVNNPAATQPLVLTELLAHRLERAWRATGTDQDVIIVARRR